MDETTAMTVNEGLMSLFKKKAQVMKLLEPIEKNGVNPTQGWRYMTASDVKLAVQQAMAQVGLCLHVTLQDISVEPTEKGRRTCAYFLISLCDPETGAVETSRWAGYGSDAYSDDKGFNKASTSALKYYLSFTFMVGSAEEDANDADRDGDKRSPQRPQDRRAPAGKQDQRPPAPKETPAPEQGTAMLDYNDQAQALKFLKWAKDTFGYTEGDVMAALRPLMKGGAHVFPKRAAIAYLLARMGQYKTDLIKQIGEKNKIAQEIVADALLIAPDAA